VTGVRRHSIEIEEQMNIIDSKSDVSNVAESRHGPVDTVSEKLSDAETPGFFAEFDPDEAERAGAFNEDALSEADALDAVFELPTGHPAAAEQ
jgi:hypothetical protein